MLWQSSDKKTAGDRLYQTRDQSYTLHLALYKMSCMNSSDLLTWTTTDHNFNTRTKTDKYLKVWRPQSSLLTFIISIFCRTWCLCESSSKCTWIYWQTTSYWTRRKTVSSSTYFRNKLFSCLIIGEQKQFMLDCVKIFQIVISWLWYSRVYLQLCDPF